jgi:hypothetical protein
MNADPNRTKTDMVMLECLHKISEVVLQSRVFFHPDQRQNKKPKVCLLRMTCHDQRSF